MRLAPEQRADVVGQARAASEPAFGRARLAAASRPRRWGACAIAAASALVGGRDLDHVARRRTTCPRAATRSSSTPSSPRAKATAARQSASWRPMSISCRGSPAALAEVPVVERQRRLARRRRSAPRTRPAALLDRRRTRGRGRRTAPALARRGRNSNACALGVRRTEADVVLGSSRLSREGIDAPGQLEVGVGEPALGMVVIVTVTLSQEISRSGWCPISSAGPTSARTNSTEPTKSPRLNFLRIASPLALPAVELAQARSISASARVCHRLSL